MGATLDQGLGSPGSEPSRQEGGSQEPLTGACGEDVRGAGLCPVATESPGGV